MLYAQNVARSANRASLLAIGALLLSGCASVEGAYVDVLTFEGDIPPEARELQSDTAGNLVAYGAPGVREFEIARRFERGNKGFPLDVRCALVFNDLSGRRTTRIRQDMLNAGTQTLTYQGFPNGRVAARRLRWNDPTPITNLDVSRCEDIVDGLRSAAD